MSRKSERARFLSGVERSPWANFAPMKNLLLLCCSSAWIASTALAQAQQKPLFDGAGILDSCVVELPLTYAKRDKERYTQAARFLEGEELIYAVRDRRSGKVNCTRVFVVVETAKDGEDVVYLETSEQHMRMDGMKQAFFPQFKASSERFYNAACFDEHLSAHPELRVHLIEGTAEAPR